MQPPPQVTWPFGLSRSRGARRRLTRQRPLEALEPRVLLATTFTQTNLVSDIAGTGVDDRPEPSQPLGDRVRASTAGSGSPTTAPGRRPSTTATASRSRPRPIPWSWPFPGPAGTGDGEPDRAGVERHDGFCRDRPAPTRARATSSSPPRTARSRAGTRRSIGPTPSSWSTTRHRVRSTRGWPRASTRRAPTSTPPTSTPGPSTSSTTNFNPVHIPGAFTDSGIPAGFAPFGIQAINGDVYVTYAKQDANKHDDVAGAGNGFIDVFDTEGHLHQAVHQPGGRSTPPGAWRGSRCRGSATSTMPLFVGNFGDGAINAYDFDTGELLGRLNDANGEPDHDPRRLGLEFGAAVRRRRTRTVSTSPPGPNGEQDGLVGVLTVNNPETTPGPQMLDPNLTVTTVVIRPGPADQHDVPRARTTSSILEKASGKVQHVVNGTGDPDSFVTPGGATLPNLPVNNASERGLLGIALDPNFATNHGVYLYWTESSTGAVSSEPRRGRQPQFAVPAGNDAAARQPGGPFRLERSDPDADVRQEHHRAPRVPAGPGPAACGGTTTAARSGSAPTASCTS